MMGIGGGGGGVRQKSTGRVMNGRQPGCQLTAAVLHGGGGGLVHENNRKKEGARGDERGRQNCSVSKVLQPGQMHWKDCYLLHHE